MYEPIPTNAILFIGEMDDECKYFLDNISMSMEKEYKDYGTLIRFQDEDIAEDVYKSLRIHFRDDPRRMKKIYQNFDCEDQWSALQNLHFTRWTPQPPARRTSADRDYYSVPVPVPVYIPQTIRDYMPQASVIEEYDPTSPMMKTSVVEEYDPTSPMMKTSVVEEYDPISNWKMKRYASTLPKLMDPRVTMPENTYSSNIINPWESRQIYQGPYSYRGRGQHQGEERGHSRKVTTKHYRHDQSSNYTLPCSPYSSQSGSRSSTPNALAFSSRSPHSSQDRSRSDTPNDTVFSTDTGRKSRIMHKLRNSRHDDSSR